MCVESVCVCVCVVCVGVGGCMCGGECVRVGKKNWCTRTSNGPFILKSTNYF